MIEATPADQSAIEAFLTKHITTSMFPLANLRRYGMTGDHPRAMRIWARWEAGAITDVVTLSREGMVLPQCPTGPWGDIRAVLMGHAVKGLIGDAGQVRQLHACLALPKQVPMNIEDPLYQLALRDLILPETTGFGLQPLSEAPRELVIGWRRAYLEEVLPMPGEDYDLKAANDIESYVAADSHRVLLEGRTPVAMTGFNAMLPEAVQVGGVYTPPHDRSRGLGRRAVAMHLNEMRTKGVIGAILFAASAQACKAYEAIGFEKRGAFAILTYEEPQVIYG